MKYRSPLIFSTLLLLGASQAMAAGPAPVGALRQACPQIDSLLQDTLQLRAWRLDEVHSLQVQFKLNGSQISEVSTEGGPQRLHEHVRRAVQALPCSSNATGEQLLTFSLALSKH